MNDSDIHNTFNIVNFIKRNNRATEGSDAGAQERWNDVSNIQQSPGQSNAEGDGFWMGLEERTHNAHFASIPQ